MTEMIPKSQSWVLVVLTSGSRAHLNCSGTLGLFILLGELSLLWQSSTGPKKPWLIKNQPNKCLKIKTFWPRAWRSSGALKLQIMFSIQIQYNCQSWINSVVTENEMTLCASQGVVYGHQVITSHSGPSLTSQHELSLPNPCLLQWSEQNFKKRKGWHFAQKSINVPLLKYTKAFSPGKFTCRLF